MPANLSQQAAPAARGLHEIKIDEYRLQVRRDDAGIVRLLTRHGIDWTARFPLVKAAP